MLSNLELEIQVTQQKRNQLRLDTEAETKRQLTERQAKLDKLQADFEASIEPIKKRKATLESEVKSLGLTLSTLGGKITAKKVEIEQQSDIFVRLKGDIEAAKTTLEQVQAEEKGVRAAISQVEASLSTQQATLNELTSEVQALEAQRKTLEQTIADADAAYVAKEAEYERKIDILDKRLFKLSEEMEATQQEQDLIRQDLAKRIMAADRREEVLSQRENKVKRDEHINKRNSELMNL